MFVAHSVSLDFSLSGVMVDFIKDLSEEGELMSYSSIATLQHWSSFLHTTSTILSIFFLFVMSELILLSRIREKNGERRERPGSARTTF